MNERIENAELRPYIYAYIIKKLEDCDLFVKTFGKGFAKRRLDLNFSKLYTNEKKRNVGGYYSAGDLSITICQKGKNGELLSIEDFENDSELRHTSLHEGVHAVLQVLKLDCKKRKIRSGTGILEFYENATELGRGLNEGLTNWICEKAGEKNFSYPILTNFVRQIEIAIGPKKTMQLARGNIKRNVSKLLGMDESKCKEFLGLADEIYTLDKKEKDVSFIVSTLSRKLNTDGTYSYFTESLKEDMDAVQQITMFANVESNPDYLDYALSNQKDYSDLETKLEYFKEIQKNLQKKIIDTRGEFESKLFTRYFKRDFLEMRKMPRIMDSDYLKYARLADLMQVYKDDANNSAAWFENEFKSLKERYFKELSERVTEEIETGKFSFARFMEYQDLFKTKDNTYSFDKQEFNIIVSKILFPEYSGELMYLIGKLEYEKQLSDLEKYSILDIGDGDTRRILFSKNGNEIYAINGIGSITMLAEDEIENPEELFDFTLRDGQVIQEVVNKFLKLKDRMLRQDPKAEIKIVNDVIIVTSNGKTAYVVIDGNDLVFVNKQREEVLGNKFSPERFNLSSHLPKVSDENPFAKFVLKIKRRLFLKKSDNVYYTEKYVPKRLIQDDKEDFEKRLSDMSNYSDTPRVDNSEKSFDEEPSKKDEFYK